MRNLILAMTATVALIAASPASADTVDRPVAPPTAAENYLVWLEDRMRLWPQELALLERSPVASAEELAQLKALMTKAEQEAQAVAAGRQLTQSPVQLQVLTIETELERLAGEADRLPILAGPTD